MTFRLLLFALIASTVAQAHAGEPLEPHDLLTLQGWVFDPAITIPLVLSAWLYWRGASPAHGTRPWEARCYWAGWATLVVSLVTPVHGMGEVLFSAHMTQHELLMLVAAPLLVLGRPLVPFLWGLPVSWRKPVSKPLLTPAVQRWWHAAARPVHAWWIHGVAIWVWHIPALYQGSVTSDAVHSLQHLSFLLSALLFWWSLLRIQHGTAALYVFATALHTGILGALLTFAPSVWYPVYEETTYAWGLSALEDQQLGGLIMWIPAGVLYTVAGLLLAASWLRSGENLSSPGSLHTQSGAPSSRTVR